MLFGDLPLTLSTTGVVALNLHALIGAGACVIAAVEIGFPDGAPPFVPGGVLLPAPGVAPPGFPGVLPGVVPPVGFGGEDPAGSPDEPSAPIVFPAPSWPIPLPCDSSIDR